MPRVPRLSRRTCGLPPILNDVEASGLTLRSSRQTIRPATQPLIRLALRTAAVHPSIATCHSLIALVS